MSDAEPTAEPVPAEPDLRTPAELMRDRIRQSSDIFERIVEVPQWASIGAGKILMRSVSARHRFEWIAWYRQHSEEYEAMADGGARDLAVRNAATVVLTAHHPDTREPLFTAEDIDWLLDKNEDVLNLLITQGVEVMGINQEAVDLGKDGSPPSRP